MGKKETERQWTDGTERERERRRQQKMYWNWMDVEGGGAERQLSCLGMMPTCVQTRKGWIVRG
jgi:hypothetical protein